MYLCHVHTWLKYYTGMSAGGLVRMLSQAARGVCGRGGPWTSTCPWAHRARLSACDNTAPSWARVLLFSSSGDGRSASVDESPAPADGSSAPTIKRKKQDPRARATISSAGRKIQQRHLAVISETGEDLGTMHRSDALRLMDEQGLKLVLLDEHADPPVYRLMSGRQIHEEQLKLREKQKAKAAGLVQVKELTFSSDIAARDLSTKLRQACSWLEKKHHVRLNLRAGRTGAAGALDTLLEKMVQQMEVTVGFVSPPKIVRDGQAAMCILRPPSAKELAQKKRKDEGAATGSTVTPSEYGHTETKDSTSS